MVLPPSIPNLPFGLVPWNLNRDPWYLSQPFVLRKYFGPIFPFLWTSCSMFFTSISLGHCLQSALQSCFFFDKLVCLLAVMIHPFGVFSILGYSLAQFWLFLLPGQPTYILFYDIIWNGFLSSSSNSLVCSYVKLLRYVNKIK